MDVYSRIESLGLTIPPVPENSGIFVGCKQFGENLLYVSGCGCTIGDRGTFGKVGHEVTLENAQNAARDSMLNFLALLEDEVGDLNKVDSFIKLLVFVSSASDFYDQPKVADGATKLLVDLFGEKIGLPSRSAVGVAVLPGNISVEIEGIVKIR